MPVNQEFKNLINKVKFLYGLKQSEIAEAIYVKSTYLSDMINGRVPVTGSVTEKIYEVFSDTKKHMERSTMQIKPNKEVDTVDFVDIPDLEDDKLEFTENSFGNKFVKLPTGGYLMYMPLFEWDVAASLLDNEGDTRHPDYEDVAQHVTIVSEPLKGKYSAFRIKGGSMEGNEVNKYIPDGSIVWGRELQRAHWGDKIRINKYPLWVVGSTEFGRPTLKEIKIHDLETATIVVDSWNPSKEYAHNVAISLNTVKMLYYVMKVETSMSHIF